MNTSTARVPAGTPSGGQFAATSRAESDVVLDEPLSHDDALAYLRGLLADTPAAPSGPGAAALRVQTVTGADLPPLVFTHPDAFDPAKVDPVSNANHSKPDGGLWLSPGTPQTGSAWDRLLASDEYAGSEVDRSRAGRVHQQVRLADDARVLRIASREDLLAAHDAYPPGPGGFGMLGRPSLDWEAVAAEYDAVWVTATGQAENHMPRDEHADVHLYAWDIESVVVLNPEAVRVG